MRLNVMSNIDYSTRDFEGYKSLMIQELKKRVPEYSDFSESDLGIVLIELLALGQDIQSYNIDRIANEVHLATSLNKQHVIELCANYGYKMKGVTPSILKQVFEIEPRENEYAIPRGFRVATPSNDYENSIIFETLETLVIPPNCTGLEKDSEGNYLYSVDVRQGYTISEELLGTSNGNPNQEFYLYESPVIEDTIVIDINEGSGFELWERVDSFLYSDKDSKHYMTKLDADDRYKIVFGDNLSGKIPDAYMNGIIAKYTVGGGVQGNVAINSITTMPSHPSDIVSTFNYTSAIVIGEDAESIESAKLNALRGMRTLERAVSLQDFVDLAYNLSFVQIASAEEVQDGRTVNIYLVSKYNNTLSEQEMLEALEFYNEVRMVGVLPVIKDVTFVPINFEVTVDKRKYDEEDYETLVTNIIKDFYSLDNVSFYQNYSQSKLLKELMILLPNIEDINVNASNVPSKVNVGELLSVGTVTVDVREV